MTIQPDTSRSHKFRRFFLEGKKKWFLLALLVVLIGARLALPYIVKTYVNKTLAVIPGYPGYIDDVDIALWRGAYVIKGMNIQKDAAKIPVPFFSTPVMDLSIEWSALFHGSLVGKILLVDPKISFVQGPTDAESQDGGGTDFIAPLKKLFPVKFNSFDVQNGEVHFRNFYKTPKVDLHLDSLFVHATNLTNSNHLSQTLVASIEAHGQVMHTGRLEGHLSIDPYATEPTFTLNMQLEKVELTSLNDFFQAYAWVGVKSGTFAMYSEVASADGKFAGYVKPLFKDMQILDVKKDAKSPLKLLWTAAVAGVAAIFTNHSTGELATKIPYSGTYENRNVDILSTIGGVLKNAFIKALVPGYEGTVSLQSAHDQ
jgi:hypothetical protein